VIVKIQWVFFFKSSSPEPASQIHSNLIQLSLDDWNSNFVLKNRQVLFKGGYNHKNVKMWWGHLKILFLRTMKPEKAEFYTKAF
jgi:hypothetical protein